jgi:hypothetical protein
VDVLVEDEDVEVEVVVDDEEVLGLAKLQPRYLAPAAVPVIGLMNRVVVLEEEEDLPVTG